MMEPYKKKILEMMVQKEEMLSRLYRVFADQSKQNREFWAELAEEETKHAEWVGKLAKAVDQGTVTFEEGSIKTYTLESYLKHVRSTLKRAVGGGLTEKQALLAAHDLEQSLLERRTFTCFVPKTEQAAKVVELLKAEQSRHVDRVAEQLERYRKSGWNPVALKP